MRKLLLTICFLASLSISAQRTFTSQASGGDWNTPATWIITGGTITNTIPGATDAVIIEGAVTIAVGASATCFDLTVTGGGARRVTINTASNLTVENDLTLTRFQDGLFIYGLGGNQMGTVIVKGANIDDKKVLIKKSLPSDNNWQHQKVLLMQ